MPPDDGELSRALQHCREHVEQRVRAGRRREQGRGEDGRGEAERRRERGRDARAPCLHRGEDHEHDQHGPCLSEQGADADARKARDDEDGHERARGQRSGAHDGEERPEDRERGELHAGGRAVDGGAARHVQPEHARARREPVRA